MGRHVVAFLLSFFGRLRFPWLFGLLALLFAIDLFIPDVVPFADEILLGGATVLLGALKKQRTEKRRDRDKNGAQAEEDAASGSR